MERKTGFELKSLDEKGLFVARIARLNAIDKDFDVTRPGAFGNHQVTPILVGHRWDTIALGKAKISEEGDEVLARGKLNLATSAGRDLYESLRFDVANPPSKAEFSYGFSLEDFEHGVFEGRQVRFLKSVRVHEVSAVIAGAGDTALVAVKQDVAPETAALVAEYHRLRERAVSFTALGERAPDGAHRYQFVALPPGNPGEGRHQFMKHRLVHQAAKAAAAELGVACPVVKWFGRAFAGDRVDFTSDGPLLGCTWHGEHAIGLNVTQGPEELADTIRHELAHLAGHGEVEAEQFTRKGAELLADAPRPGTRWTYDQMVAAATWMRHQGVRV